MRFNCCPQSARFYKRPHNSLTFTPFESGHFDRNHSKSSRSWVGLDWIKSLRMNISDSRHSQEVFLVFFPSASHKSGVGHDLLRGSRPFMTILWFHAVTCSYGDMHCDMSISLKVSNISMYLVLSQSTITRTSV